MHSLKIWSAFLLPVQSSVYADASAEADVAEADTTMMSTSTEYKNYPVVVHRLI